VPGGRCLVLNADMSLVHVTPTWFEGVELLCADKAHPLALYEDKARSQHAAHDIPAVVVLKRYVKIGRRRPSFAFPSKRNILVRDGFACAYCGKPLTMGTVTREHVVPTCRGGKDALTNVVSACWQCNNRKGDKTPSEAGMTLRVKPRELTAEEKVQVIVKTHKAHERAVWLTCLKQHGLELA